MALPLGPSPFPREIKRGTLSGFSALCSKSGLNTIGALSILSAYSCLALLRYFYSFISLIFQALMIS